jgi:isopenicillin N synthase-like dioxygenase
MLLPADYSNINKNTMQLLRSGYAIVTIPNCSSLFGSSFSGVNHYFNQAIDIKKKDSHSEMEYGYRNFGYKESFAVRHLPLPADLQTCVPLIQLLYSMAQTTLQQVAQYLQIADGNLINLLDENPLPMQHTASSLLRILHYHPLDQQTPEYTCNIHQDLGLLTLAPRSTLPALEIYNYNGTGEWLDVETSMGPDDVIIMVGETLSLLSNNLFLPASHRVRQSASSRLSLVYQVRARNDAELNSENVASSVTGKFSQPFVMSGKEFYEKERQSRSSVNHSY